MPYWQISAVVIFCLLAACQFFYWNFFPFFLKTAALCLEKTGWSVYLEEIRTKLVLIVIIIRNNAGFKRFTAF